MSNVVRVFFINVTRCIVNVEITRRRPKAAATIDPKKFIGFMTRLP